jgi:hypothetical protein
VPAWLAALLICLVLGAALRARLQVGKLRRELVGDRWKMVLSAGHSVTGQSKYNERIADTLSTLPLETGGGPCVGRCRPGRSIQGQSDRAARDDGC